MVSVIPIPKISNIYVKSQGLVPPGLANLVISQRALPPLLPLSLSLSLSLALSSCLIGSGGGRGEGGAAAAGRAVTGKG